MLTPNEYDHLCDQLTVLYAALDESIIEDIARRMLKTGRVTDTARWQAQQLQQAGMLYEDVLAEIAKRTDATQAHVRALFEEAGVQSIRNDNRFYRAAGLEGIVKMSDAALQTLNAGYAKCAGNLQNLTLTTANTAQQAYIQASDLAYMQVTTGTMDYNTAIRHAIRSAADEGSFVLYPSGHRDRLDVAVRRAVLTGVGQTVRQLSLINAEDMGCDLMEITAHGGARPSHAAWQGKIVSRSGRRGYLTLQDIGYGRGDGFGGWNCRHDWHPFFEGISQRAYTDARLRELEEPHTEIDGRKYTDYEVSQMQRALERNIRKQKRQVAAANAMAEAAPDEALRKAAQEDFTRESVKLKQAEQELKDFCKQTGSLPDTSRVWVNGFGRSVSQRAVHQNNAAFRERMKKLGIKNPPKSLAEFEKMRYNDPKEYSLIQAYVNSVERGAMSPLVGYDKYKEYHERIEQELVGITTPSGIKITGQSKHLLERVFGTISDPDHNSVVRNGVEIDDIKEALLNGKFKKPKEAKNKKGEIVRSQAFYTDKCLVTVNPDTGVIIQCNPY